MSIERAKTCHTGLTNVNDLLELVKKPESEMHKLITFHIRTMGDEHIGIAFNEDLTLNEDLAESERDKRKPGEK